MIIKLKPYVKKVEGYWVKEPGLASFVHSVRKYYKIYLSRTSGQWVFYDYYRMRTVAKEQDLEKLKIIANDYIRKMLDRQ